MEVSTWTFTLSDALANLSIKILSFLPNILAALIVFLLGLIISDAAAKIVRLMVRKSQVDVAFEKLGITQVFKDAGFDLSVAEIAAWMVKWFIIVVFLIAVANALALSQVSDFINQVALYLPNVLVAAAILTIGVVVANALSEAVHRAAVATELVSAGLVAGLVKWSILVFVFLAVLAQLKIAPNLVETLFTGMVASLSLALGLSFGLGGKDKAKEMIEAISREVKKKK